MSHLAATLAALSERFASDMEVVEFRGETTVIIAREALLDALRLLKETPALDYRMLSHVTAYDDWPDEPRFNVVYLVRDLEHLTSLRLRVRLRGDDAVLPSVTSLYPNAGWAEREVFDMFGVRFTGNPDLRRILMPMDWEGHPLRKDFPLGYEEVEFTFNFDEIEKKKPYAKD